MATILLVENDPMNRDMIRRWLERWGYQVLLAQDGAEGVALARTTHPDLIVMDINMPTLDGLEATACLKGSPATQAIPILVLTANAMSGDRGRALAAGADEYESKPVQFSSLQQKIAGLILPAAPPGK
jgi:CheY-like chemotaxis protein